MREFSEGSWRRASFSVRLTLLLVTASSVAQPAAAPAKVCAGAYYFDGWTGESCHLTSRLGDACLRAVGQAPRARGK
jgi:hypothetical protein